MILDLNEEVRRFADPKRAEANAWYFKTGKGEYGEGDKFAGLSVPICRKIAKKFKDLPLNEIKELLKSKVHEERLIALFILVNNFVKADTKYKEEIFDFYLKNTRSVNNWDLVDSSASQIVGGYLKDKPRDVLEKLVRSNNIWERRIAVISTFAFINLNQFEDALKIAENLLSDKHDLIHKAVGWMLREVGKKSEPELVKFLASHYKIMPRTMLRYAIEKFDEDTRKKYLQSLI